MKKEWYNTRYVKAALTKIVKYIDDLFHDCDVLIGDKAGYDLSQHNIFVRKRQKLARLELVAGMLKMLILNLAPGSREVKYQGKDHILVSLEGMYNLAGRLASSIYKSISTDGDWVSYIKRKFTPPKKPKEPLISKEDLAYMYYDKKLTHAQIGEIIGREKSTVSKMFDRYDMPSRPLGGPSKYISADKLADLYYEQDFTLSQIGEILGVEAQTVLVKMEAYGLPRRDKRSTMPVAQARVKAFKSLLRKKFRRNPYYIGVAREIVEQAERDPDLYQTENTIE